MVTTRSSAVRMTGVGSSYCCGARDTAQLSSSSKNMKGTESKQKRGSLDQLLVTVKRNRKIVSLAWMMY